MGAPQHRLDLRNADRPLALKRIANHIGRRGHAYDALIEQPWHVDERASRVFGINKLPSAKQPPEFERLFDEIVRLPFPA